MELQEIERRLVGKNKEDEFILILLFMEVCKSITAFDEGVSQLLKTATSDLLVELQNEKKFMLEIKQLTKNGILLVWEISKKELIMRVNMDWNCFLPSQLKDIGCCLMRNI